MRLPFTVGRCGCGVQRSQAGRPTLSVVQHWLAVVGRSVVRDCSLAGLGLLPVADVLLHCPRPVRVPGVSACRGSVGAHRGTVVGLLVLRVFPIAMRFVMRHT